MHDEQIFPKPKELIPERFLEDLQNGNGVSIKVFYKHLCNIKELFLYYLHKRMLSCYILIKKILKLLEICNVRTFWIWEKKMSRRLIRRTFTIHILCDGITKSKDR